MIKSLKINDANALPTNWWAEVKHLKKITELEFHPEKPNILWGPNGCGKSTILKLIGYLTASLQGGTSTITYSAVRDMNGRHKELNGAELVTDGQSVAYLDTNAEIGLIGGAFDDDFFTVGLQNTMFGRKRSSGERFMAEFNRIYEAQGKSLEVDDRCKYLENDDERNQGYRIIRDSLSPKLDKGLPTMMMDEPCRSLSIPMQEQFWFGLAHSKKAKMPRQFIVATHSVFALGRDFNYIDIESGYLDKCLECVSRLSKTPR